MESIKTTMTLRTVSLLLLLLLLLGITEGKETDRTIVGVLLASSPLLFREQAWIHNHRGLVLLTLRRNDPILQFNQNETTSAIAAVTQDEFESMISAAATSVFLGDGFDAAFDDNGDLYFRRNDPPATEDWMVKYKRSSPTPVAIHDEGIPKIVEERRLARKNFLLELRKEREEALQMALLGGDKAKMAPFKITLDPGHGGSDAGAVAQGYQEKAFNLDVSNRLRTLLQADRGLWTVQVTRSTDVDVSLNARTTMANNWPADRFVSIHTNSFTSSTAQGTETYSFAEGSTAAKLRDRIQSEAVKAWGLTNRGSKTADFYVLRYTTMPATLSEMGFITSPVDIKKLSDPNARQQMAAAHLYALQYHFGVSLNMPLELEEELQ